MGDKDDKADSVVSELIKMQADIKSAGEEIGYTEDKLVAYVEEKMAITTKRMQDKYERDQRALEMTLRKAEREEEMKAREREREDEMKQKAIEQEQEFKMIEARKQERAQEQAQEVKLLEARRLER